MCHVDTPGTSQPALRQLCDLNVIHANNRPEPPSAHPRTTAQARSDRRSERRSTGFPPSLQSSQMIRSPRIPPPRTTCNDPIFTPRQAYQRETFRRPDTRYAPQKNRANDVSSDTRNDTLDDGPELHTTTAAGARNRGSANPIRSRGYRHRSPPRDRPHRKTTPADSSRRNANRKTSLNPTTVNDWKRRITQGAKKRGARTVRKKLIERRPLKSYQPGPSKKLPSRNHSALG